MYHLCSRQRVPLISLSISSNTFSHRQHMMTTLMPSPCWYSQRCADSAFNGGGLPRGYFISEPGRTPQHKAALAAQLIHDAENLAPRKLGQLFEKAFERAGPLLTQVQSNGRFNRHHIHLLHVVQALAADIVHVRPRASYSREL